MRDYCFGNFISELRERAGLSQYQLGALVGVSDKAVSKWENGAAKPRIATIRKLSEIFDVSVDELLTCEYGNFQKERKDLFAMKNEILRVAQHKMAELYGEQTPVRIANRFQVEKLMLEGQEVLLWMGFFGELRKKFSENNLYLEIKTPQMGASLITWLLGGTDVNPLPAHYYCPECKRVEFDASEKFGADLPQRNCSCGTVYQRDGFGIDAMNMYPFTKGDEIYVSDGGTELAKKCLQEYFQGHGDVCVIKTDFDEEVMLRSPKSITRTRFGIFSKETVRKFYENEMLLSAEEYYRMSRESSILDVIENVEEQICGKCVTQREYTKQQLRAYLTYAIENGKYVSYGSRKNLEDILPEIENPSFRDLIAIFGLSHSTGTWNGNGEVLYEKGIPISSLISCREDVYDYLYAKLNGKCCENPSGLAFEMKEMVRKGKYFRNGMPEEVERLLADCEVPIWYIESMKKILYLFPKTYLITRLKKELYKFVTENPEGA